jgi:hypothetical protein
MACARLVLTRGAIADAGDLELLLKALGDAFDQVGDLRTRGAVHGLRAVGLDPRRDLDRAVLELHLDIVMDDELKLALRPLHLYRLPFDARRHTRRDRHRPLADT